MIWVDSVPTAGSSPLTRGKRRYRHELADHERLIPAHAGKTPYVMTGVKRVRAHPRSRGENLTHAPDELEADGSSPLTRGKLRPLQDGLRRPRLIPAHAGKTHGRGRQGAGTAAHPRSRGENRGVCATTPYAAGSSPLTRGKRWARARTRYPLRLIPAHAGKTAHSSALSASRAAHPRSRGENRARGVLNAGMSGSSPLTRGKRSGLRARALRRRLIPAHAGKTRPILASWIGVAAHPRSRGENIPLMTDLQTRAGSSPLTRGKPGDRSEAVSSPRLIPAHAGKTAPAPTSHTSARAHPRSRGENGTGSPVLVFYRGSSPLTRGKLGDLHPGRSVRRLIPAHAGKTPC